jgi:hypothetical protein
MKWFINQRKTIARISLLFLISQISLPLLGESVHDQPDRAPRHDYENLPEDVFGGQPYITYIPKDVHITGDLTVDGSLITPGGSGLFVLKTGDSMSGNLVMSNQKSIYLQEPTTNGTNTINLQAPSSITAPYTITFPASQGDQYGAPINDGSGNLTWQNPCQMVAAIDGDMTGFVNIADSTISFDGTSNTFAIAPTASAYTIYCHGKEVIIDTAKELIIDADVTGPHYIFFAPPDALHPLHYLKEYYAFPGFDAGILISVIYWDGYEQTAVLTTNSRHISKCDLTWLTWVRNIIGTQHRDGLTMYGYKQNSDLDANIQVGLYPGTIVAGELVNTITDGPITAPLVPFQQPIAYPASIPILYHDEELPLHFHKDPATLFPYKNNGAGTRLNFNQYNAELNVWQQTQATDGYYVAYWICATSSMIQPIICIQGERQDATIDDAQLNNNFLSLTFGDFPFEILRPLYLMIMQTSDSYTNSMKAIIRDVTDLRAQTLIDLRDMLPISHSTLVGVANTNSHPADAIATVGLSGLLSGQTDVQESLSVLGNNIDQGLNTTSSPTFAGLRSTLPILADGGVNVTGPGGSMNIGTANTSNIHIGDSTTPHFTSDIYIGTSGTTIHMPGTVIQPIIIHPEIVGQYIDLNLTTPPRYIVSTSNSGMRICDGINPSGAQITTNNDSTGWILSIPTTLSSGIMTLSPGSAGFSITGGSAPFTIVGGATPFTINQGSHDPLTLGTANGLTLDGVGGQVLSLQAASSLLTGALTSTDWNTFYNKQTSTPTLNALAPFASTGIMVMTNATTPAFAARTIIGTTNQISVANGNGVSANPQLSLPQDIALTSNPTFASMTLGNSVAGKLTLREASANGTNYVALQSPPALASNITLTFPSSTPTNGYYLQTDGSGNLSWSAVSLTSGITGVLPIVNGGTNSATALSNSRIMVSSGGAIVEASALSNGMVAQTAANTFTARTITGASNQVSVANGDGVSGNPMLSLPSTVILTGASSINSSSSTLAIGDSVTTTLTLGRAGQAVTVASTLNVDSGIIDRTAAGTLAIGGTNVTTLSLGRSGQTTAILGNHTIAGTTVASGSITLNAANELRFADSDSSNYVGFKSGATIASNVVWTLPTTDGTLDQALVTNGSGTTSWATLPRVEALDYFLTPPYNTQNSGAAATRVAQTSFEGAIYTLYRDVTFSKVGLRLTAFTAPGRLSMYFYQTPTGAASSAGSPAARVAGITSATPVSGVNTITLDSPGSATLKAGIVYVLWGRSSATGAFTLRTLSTLDMDLCNQNMITGTAPMTYSTGIAANTTPATFNAATQSSASSNDVTPILRLTNF